MIESVNNDRVKYWCKLNDRKYQDLEEKFLVEGEHLVSEAYKTKNLIEVIILDGYDFDYENKTYVSKSVMKKISALTTTPKIIGVVKKIKSTDIFGRVLILDAIQNPGNMGTILRSAVAFNIDTVIVGTGSVSIYNSKVIRASEGMLFKLNIVESSLDVIFDELHKDGYKIMSTSVTDGVDIKKVRVPLKSAIVIGNEGSGISEFVKKNTDEFIHIKMNELCESLNVGVATSIILYELNND